MIIEADHILKVKVIIIVADLILKLIYLSS